MRVLVIYCHLVAESFCAARVLKALVDGGHAVTETSTCMLKASIQ